MHQTSGRWQLGFALALATSILWGTLPVALTVAVERVDPETVTWLRFLISALVLGAVLGPRRVLPSTARLTPKDWVLIAISLAGLLGNYLTYLHALRYLSPTVNQIVIQLAPLFLLVGGLVVFRERFGSAQRLGVVILIVGLLLFFNQRLADLRAVSRGFAIGIALLVIAAMAWAIYGIAQKLLMRTLGSQQILLLVYVGAAIVLLPVTHPLELAHISARHGIALAYCCINTLLSYGAFVAALEHWEVSRVGAVLATAPIFTLLTVWFTHWLWPGLVPPEPLNALSVVGALAVVGGSVVSALGGRAAIR